ncbi:helix-turn-helix domain-containing protein [Pseudoflavonifractor phocaeensis]|uniref:helix-turn-helix domain-containing protein n=1 Tax=Pseudoflavonifractor phocaeensis TaxID=1870988 RepID=UPI00210E45DE|nr:helix-turn-helix transcriptional regulator [Pseudoflavonifractor phocaeensis]MCQ4862737.1 helix-turn-helix domain-containing protein [Pseudoflavonifractor phocaeensis]
MESTALRQIGNRIAELRHKNQMTQSELAIACGLTLKTISMVENGQRELKVDSLLRICEHLNVSADYVLHGVSLDSDALCFRDLIAGLEPEVAQRVKDLLVSLSKNYKR